MLIGVAFVPIGIALLSTSNSVVEETVTYDDSEQTSWCQRDNVTKLCKKGSENFQNQKVDGEAKNGNYITFDITKDMKAPVHLYYQLDNFYQNHRRYVKSRDDKQMRGVDDWVKKNEQTWDSTVTMDAPPTMGQKIAVKSVFPLCSPLILPNHVGGANCRWNTTNGADHAYPNVPCKVMWPCGLIAGSFFNDYYVPVDDQTTPPKVLAKFAGTQENGLTLKITDASWSEKDIAWLSDRQTKFKNPSIATANWNYADDVAKGASSWYYHLYQMYPTFPNLKVEGVQNEHFIVWVRTAGLPTFRKLYSRINKDLKAGTTYTVYVNPGFNVTSFKGKKRLVLSTTSWMGGKNAFLGVAYVTVGGVSLILGLLFFIMDRMKPRVLGDTNYLVWS